MRIANILFPAKLQLNNKVKCFLFRAYRYKSTKSVSYWCVLGAFVHCEVLECEDYWEYIRDFRRKWFQKDIDAVLLRMCKKGV